MENKFKVGDRVKIIDSRIFNNKLKVGDVGEITDVDEWGICIDFRKDGGRCQICGLSTAPKYIKLAKPEKEENSVIDVLKTSDKYREMLAEDSFEELKKIIDKKSLDEQIEYHEKRLIKLKAQKEKEKWVFTEDEKVILRNLAEEYNYITRDMNGKLYIFVQKPRKSDIYWTCDTDNYMNNVRGISMFNHLFQCIEWSDTEPCEFRKYI